MLAMNRMPLSFIGIIALGCASGGKSHSAVAPSPAIRSVNAVRLFYDRAPQCRYEMLGRAESRRQTGMGMDATMMSFRRQARDRGGDAIIRVEWRADMRGPSTARRQMLYYSNRPILTGEFAPYDEGVVTGIVIRFTDPNCRR